MPSNESHRGLTLSIFAGASVFGIVMSSLGSLLPGLFQAIKFEKVDAGGLFLAMNFAMMVSSLVFGPICDRFGYRVLLLVSTLLIAGAFTTLSGAEGYAMIVAGLTLLGLGGGALNGGVNALLNDISPDRRESAMNLLGIFFGFGALLTPFLIGSFLQQAGLKAILVALVLLTLAPFVLFLTARFPAPKHGEEFSWSTCVQVLRDPLLFLFAFLLFFQSGNEFTVGGWISTYLGERFGMDPRSAAYALAGYWAAIMLGRLTVSRLGMRVSASALVVTSALVGLVGALGMVLCRSGAAAVAFVVAVGLGFAAIFPTTLAQVGSVFAAYSGTAFSFTFAVALTGGMTIPWLVGRVAQNHGVGNGLWVTVFNCAAIVILQCIIRGWRKEEARDAHNQAFS